MEAGAAPDLGIGGSVGVTPEENIISFEAILNEPDLKVMISLTPGFGDFRDGITTRNADNLNVENSVIYSLSNQSGTDLEILGPKNEDVGLYRLFLKAKDQSGESATTDFMINVKNVLTIYVIHIILQIPNVINS